MDTTDQSRRAKRQRLDPTDAEQNTSLFDESSITQRQGSASNLSMYHNAGQPWARNYLSVGMHYHQYYSTVPLTGFLETASSQPCVHPGVNIYPTGYRINLPAIEQVAYHQTQWRPQLETCMSSDNAEHIPEPAHDQFRYNTHGENSGVDQSASVATGITELICFGMVSPVESDLLS